MWDLKRLARVKELVKTATGAWGERRKIAKTLALEFGATEVSVRCRIRYLQDIGMIPPYPEYTPQPRIFKKSMPRWSKEEESLLRDLYLKGIESNKTYYEIAREFCKRGNRTMKAVSDRLVRVYGSDTRDIKWGVGVRYTKKEVELLNELLDKGYYPTRTAREFISKTNSHRTLIAVCAKAIELREERKRKKFSN